MTTPNIEELKRQWQADPCWNIETTEGYENHYQELLDYRRECERQWRVEYNQKMLRKAMQLGDPGNIKLAEWVVSIEARLEKVERWMEGE